MTGFPECLLREVLDHFSLEELLLSAMPVSRFWRWSTIEHPRYWQRISLDEDSPHRPCLRVSSLFFLRLERAGAKPVKLEISLQDPTAVLDTITRHLYHIHSLKVSTMISHSDALFNSMRDPPAPILQSLHLHFRGKLEPESGGLVVVPAILFALNAPMLTEVGLIKCALPSASEGGLPAWLSNVASFTWWNDVYPIVRQLPDIFACWPRLCDVRLSGRIGLDNPAFLRASTWARIEFLSLDGWMLRRLHPLPLSQIPRIKISDTIDFTADHIVFIADAMTRPGPLDVTFVAHRAYYVGGDPVPVVSVELVLKCLSDTGPRGRWTKGMLPRQAPGRHPADFITAFQHAPLLSRIALLSIALYGWELLVDRGYFSNFPAVETLVLTLDRWGWFSAWAGRWRKSEGSKKLELPRLQRLVLRYEHDGPPYCKPQLRLADLAEFVTEQLSGARLPLRLALEGVEVEGVHEEFSDVIRT